MVNKKEPLFSYKAAVEDIFYNVNFYNESVEYSAIHYKGTPLSIDTINDDIEKGIVIVVDSSYSTLLKRNIVSVDSIFTSNDPKYTIEVNGIGKAKYIIPFNVYDTFTSYREQITDWYITASEVSPLDLYNDRIVSEMEKDFRVLKELDDIDGWS